MAVHMQYDNQQTKFQHANFLILARFSLYL